MKRTSVAFWVAMLCSLCLLVNTRTVMAFKTGYLHTTYPDQNPVTPDGKWTNDTEWNDGLQDNISANAVFKKQISS